MSFDGSPDLAARTFYERVLPTQDTDRAWQELQPDGVLHGLAARLDGELVGIAHFLTHASTTSADVCYLQDLYTAPEARGRTTMSPASSTTRSPKTVVSSSTSSHYSRMSRTTADEKVMLVAVSADSSRSCSPTAAGPTGTSRRGSAATSLIGFGWLRFVLAVPGPARLKAVGAAVL